MSTLVERISQRAKLVSLPDIYLRLKAVLDDPNSNLADVADVVGTDPAMTARVLRLVNSAYFGLATEIATVSRAISLLGSQEVHDLVLTVSVAESFDGMSNEVMDMSSFWRRSVVCAITGRELASMCNVLDSERLFVAGLLRDIGHLFIYQATPQKAQQAIQRIGRDRGIPLVEAARYAVQAGEISGKGGGQLVIRCPLTRRVQRLLQGVGPDDAGGLMTILTA